MSQQLKRIRSLILDIEEIQKKGQQSCASVVPVPGLAAVPTPAPALIPEPVAEVVPPVIEEMEAKVVEQLTPVVSPVAVPPLPVCSTPTPVEAPLVLPLREPEKPGRIEMQLAGNLVIALEMEGMGEVVEIRRISSPQNCIEIRFADGKAVHLPLKTVA